MRKLCMLSMLFLMVGDATATANNAIRNVNNQAGVSVGYLATQLNSVPRLDNSQYLKGHQLSLTTVLTKTFYQHLYSQIALSGTAGNLSYGRNTPLTTATTFLEQVSLRLGYSFFPAKTMAFTPYLAGGYQYWQLDTGGKHFRRVIRDGVTKFYQNGYWALGLLSQVAASPRLVLSLDMLAGKQVNPWMRYNASDVHNPSIGTSIIYQQAQLLPKVLYQVGAGLDYLVTPALHANAGVQYGHTQYSSTVTTPSHIKQPHLSMATMNYNLGFGYSLDTPETPITYYYDNMAESILSANNQVSLLFGYIAQGYAETIPGLGHYFDREEGNIPVIALALNKTFERIYAQFSLSLGAGGTAYKGGINGDNTAIFNTGTRNTLFDTALKLGYMIPLRDKASLTPYIAGGFHRWLRDVAGVGDNGFLTFGYPETYQHAWYALGLLAQFTPAVNWVVNVDGNVGTNENGQNRSWSSLASTHTVQQTLSLKQRFAFNLGAGTDYRFLQNWHALAQINYWYFKYGRTATSSVGVYEPNSTTRQLSFLIGLGYALD